MKNIVPEQTISPFSVAMVASQFNPDIVHSLVRGAHQRLEELAIPAAMITLLWVPGAIEIPLMAKKLAETNQYEAIVCLGAVIKGETSHFDYVCQQVSYGCQKVALENRIPVIFGVLTTETEEQAQQRAGGKEGNKGRDAIDTAAIMVSLTRQVAKL